MYFIIGLVDGCRLLTIVHIMVQVIYILVPCNWSNHFTKSWPSNPFITRDNSTVQMNSFITREISLFKWIVVTRRYHFPVLRNAILVRSKLTQLLPSLINRCTSSMWVYDIYVTIYSTILICYTCNFMPISFLLILIECLIHCIRVRMGYAVVQR